MRTLAYIGLVGAFIALAMVLSGPHIKASGTQWRAAHRTISGPLVRTYQDTGKYWSTRI
jgi:hypothetical protein